MSASKCATCGRPVHRSTAAAIVWTTPPRFWCFACWDGGDTAVRQHRAAQMPNEDVVALLEQILAEQIQNAPRSGAIVRIVRP